MSEPVTQAEIEDVLSSIRRLVSEDTRSARDEALAQDVPTDAPKEAMSPTPLDTSEPEVAKSVTRLVLTPALRVSEPETASAPVATEAVVGSAEDTLEDFSAEPPAEDSQPAAHPDTHSLTQVPDAAASEALGAGADGAAGEVVDAPSGNDAPWKDPWATLYQAAGVEGAGEDDSAPVYEAAPTAPADRVSAVVQKITELEAKVARSKEQWEPEGRTADPFAGSNIELLQWRDHGGQDDGDIHSDGPDPSDEAPVFHQHQEAEDHDALETQEDHDLMQAALEATGDDLAADVLDSLSGEDAYIDEESLREMVADIVRQELQGALGERITRNVRKLVRREIHRALAAHDLL